MKVSDLLISGKRKQNPFKMEMDGNISLTDSKFHFEQTTQEILTGFKVELTAEFSLNIDGFKLTPFERKITYTFTRNEYEEFTKVIMSNKKI